MCVGGLFAGRHAPAMPISRQATAAPTVKSAQRAADYVEPEKIKEETGDDEKIDTKKKKALEIKKTKEGV